MIWIIVPLLILVVFGLYVRREAERIRADDLRPKVTVRLKLAGDGMATPAEVKQRQAIEDAIEKRGIGSITDTASGQGWATLQVAVSDQGAATVQIRELLQERGLPDAVVEAATTAL